jgi:transcription antitermination protein NusB
MLNKSILPFEPLHSFYEEKSIYWLDDWELVNKTIIKMLKLCAESGGELVIPGLYKDISDRQFAIELFKRTIVNQADFDKIISAKTKNWDMERIALMDVIIMQMAISEILKFPEIPVKVSLNEYIELSKMYSTPRSNIFVNGVLDKLVDDFTEQKLISRYDGR